MRDVHTCGACGSVLNMTYAGREVTDLDIEELNNLMRNTADFNPYNTHSKTKLRYLAIRLQAENLLLKKSLEEKPCS